MGYNTWGFFYNNVWVSYSDLSSVVVGYAWQLICQVSPWLLFIQGGTCGVKHPVGIPPLIVKP